MSVDLTAIWLHISQMLALVPPTPEQPTSLVDVGDDLVAENARLRAEVARLREGPAHGLD